MKKLHSFSGSGLTGLCMLLVALFSGSFAAYAGEPMDVGEIEIGKTYDLSSCKYNKFTATLTVPKSGTLYKLSGGSIGIYSDAAHTDELEDTYVGYDNNRQKRSYQVEANKTYYVYSSFVNENDVTFFMDGVSSQPLAVNYTVPDVNTSFNFANYKNFQVCFNQNVTVENEATVVCGTQTAKLPVSYNSSSYIASVSVYTYVKPLLENGTVKPEDPLTITFNNVKAVNSDQSDNYTFNFRCGSIPVTKIRDNIPSAILSYTEPGDPRGILSLTFDNDVMVGPHTRVTLTWGDIEAETGAYYEELTPTLSADKRTLSVDFGGIVRTPATMLPVTPDAMFNAFDVRFVGVVDAHGNPVASSGQGTIGSYSWSIPYTLLERTNITADFTPGNGGSLQNVSNLELYIAPADAFTFTGFKFAYTDGDQTASIVVPVGEVSAVPEDGGIVYTIPVPAVVKGKKNIVVTLDGLKTTDGYNHDADIKATYDGFVVTYCDPRNGSTLTGLKDGDIIEIAVNYTKEQYPDLYIVYDITDLQPSNPEEAIVKTESWFTLGDNGYYSSTVYGDYKFISGHTYRMNVTAYQSEDDTHYGAVNPPLGTYSIDWTGATPPYQYSSIQLVSVDPTPGTVIPNKETEITIEWDGMIMMDADTSFIFAGGGMSVPFQSITPTDPDENGYSNIWKLVVPESYMSGLKGELGISFVGIDMDGRRVQGNLGTDELTYFYYSYETENEFADYTLAVAGEAPYKTVKQFVASSSNGINFSFYNAVGDAYVVNKRMHDEVVARVADYTLADFEVGDPCPYVTLTLDKEITAAGEYELVIPKGYFMVGEQYDALRSVAKTLLFTSEGGEPSGDDKLKLTLDPAEGEVTSLSSIDIIFDDYTTVGAGSGKATMTVDGGESIVLPDAEFGVEFNEMIQPLTKSSEVTITEAGTYVITFPAGYFNLGDAGDPSPEFSLTYTIAGTVEPKLNITVDPAEGKVESLDEVEITFIDYISASAGSGKATLTIDGGEPVILPDAEWGVELNAMKQKVTNGDAYTATGTYVISFPEGYFLLGESGDPAPAFSLTYLIGNITSAALVPAEDGLFHVFTVDGIEVLSTADKAELRDLRPGLYIINGAKVILK